MSNTTKIKHRPKRTTNAKKAKVDAFIAEVYKGMLALPLWARLVLCWKITFRVK